jgi:hypothetical protein
VIFLVSISNQVAEIDLQARKALNFIETGRNRVFDAYKKCDLNLFIFLQSSHSNAHSIFLLVSTTNKKWDYSYFSLCMYID